MVEQMPTREAAPMPEAKPSPALALRLYHGKFDLNQPVTKDTQGDNFASALKALHNQNIAKRKADEAAFAAKNQNPDKPLSSKDIRHNQMVFWSLHATSDLINDLKTEGRKDRTAALLRDKLHFPLEGNLGEDTPAIVGSFYDADSQTEGAFYKKFCTDNMNENLAKALTVDDMMHLKTFLTKWMVGSDKAFAALIALRHSIDIVGSKENAATMQATVVDQLPDRDQAILGFFREGLAMKEDDEKTKEAVNQQLDATEPDKKHEQSPLVVRTGSKTEAHPEHPDRNDDTYFLDAQNLRGGIFDGAGGYSGGDRASKAARDAVQEVFDKHPLPGYPEKPAIENLHEALELANDRVKNLQSGKTTGSVFQVVRGADDGKPRLLVVHIGDSRVWVRRADGSIEQVTQDGNNLRAMYRKALTRDMVYAHRQELDRQYNKDIQALDNAQKLTDLSPGLQAAWQLRNQTSLLGGDVETLKAQAELFETPLHDGDVVFMTTDGVHDNLTRTDIERIARETADPQELSVRLVAGAKEVSLAGGFRSKPDDITAVAYLPDLSRFSTNPIAA